MSITGSSFEPSEKMQPEKQATLRVNELLLMSDVEKKARRVRFHPRVMLIRGTNQTGKSSILKSIYATFGAEPKVSGRWEPARVISAVRFDIDGVHYTILRNGSFYALFDSVSELIGSFDRVTEGLGPVFANLVNFKMTHLSKQGEIITPPPSYYLLPFFVDQDLSWGKNWNAFRKLQQLSNWRRPLAEYHTGLKPNKYFTAKAKADENKLQIAELEREMRVLDGLLKKAEEASQDVFFDADLEAFKQQIEELVSKAEELRKIEESLKAVLVELHDARIQKEQELKIIEARRAEATADFDFATIQLGGEPIHCSRCGTEFDNAFADRLEIARDEDRLNEMAVESALELEQLRAKIRAQQTKFSNSRDEVRKINAVLETQIEQVTLASLIQNEGRKELRSLVRVRISDTSKQLAETIMILKSLKSELRHLTDKDRIAEIMSEYRGLMRAFLEQLGVPGAVDVDNLSIDSEIKGTGSELPRALLAYYLSVFTLISRHSTATLCPLIVDCPNQQDLDPDNQKRVLELLASHRSDNEQLIIGLRETYGVEFEGDEHVLNTEFGALDEGAYGEVEAEIRPLLHTALGIG